MRTLTQQRRRGSSYIEFVLVGAFIFVPIILGLLSVGFNLVRGMQVIHFNRDVGRMYVRGVDFARQENQDLMAYRLAAGLSIQSNTGNVTGGNAGNGVVVLSTLQKIDPALCSCNNANHIVVMRRIVIGNNTLFVTPYGAPNAALIDPSTGNVQNYFSDLSARADNFSNVLALRAGEIGYLVETYFSSNDLGNSMFPTMAAFARSVF